MKHKINTLIICVLILSFSFILAQQKTDITSDEVRIALRLINIKFKEEYVETLKGYLERNKRGYQELRESPLDNNVKPAVSFSLDSPPSYVYDIAFDLIETELPENKTDLVFYSLRELAYLIKNKRVTSKELTVSPYTSYTSFAPCLSSKYISCPK